MTEVPTLHRRCLLPLSAAEPLKLDSQLKEVYQLAVDIRKQLQGFHQTYANAYSGSNIFGLDQHPDFYGLVAPEYKQFFDILGINVPEMCDPFKARQLPSQEFCVETHLVDLIPNPKTTLDQMLTDKKSGSVDKIFIAMANAMARYQFNAKSLPAPDANFASKSPADKLAFLEIQMKQFIENSDPSITPGDEQQKKALIYGLAVSIQAAFKQYTTVVGPKYPDLYGMISSPDRQLFDILGQNFPDRCDPTKTPPALLQSPEDYLVVMATYSRIGDSKQSYQRLKIAVATLIQKMKYNLTDSKQ